MTSFYVEIYDDKFRIFKNGRKHLILDFNDYIVLLNVMVVGLYQYLVQTNNIEADLPGPIKDYVNRLSELDEFKGKK